MSKTYQPGLYLVLNTAYKYATRWAPKLQDSLSPEAYTCLLATIAAIGECLPLIIPAPPQGNAS